MTSRNKNSYNRVFNARKTKDLILIVCEDSKSSPSYFKFLRKKLLLSTASIVVVGEECHNAAISVVEEAVNRKKKAKKLHKKFEKIYCVVDVEMPKQSSLDKAFNVCEGNGIKLILSNPCYEYWLLLHFEKSAFFYTKKNYLFSKLKEYYPDYDKSGNMKLFELIYDDTQLAIDRSNQIKREKNYTSDLRDSMPSTDIDIVVDYMKKM